MIGPCLICIDWTAVVVVAVDGVNCFCFQICGFVLLALGTWTINDKLFLEELLRNNLYSDVAYIIIVVSSLLIFLSMFGCFAAVKEVKCLLLTYSVFMLLVLVILAVSGVLAYIFREQVVNTILAEMIADIRMYDPADPENSVTRAWDLTQSTLGCCGLLTDGRTQPWEMWRSNKYLNPSADYQVPPINWPITIFNQSNYVPYQQIKSKDKFNQLTNHIKWQIKSPEL